VFGKAAEGAVKEGFAAKIKARFVASHSGAFAARENDNRR
jgi:hypothetical protein